VNYWLHNEWLLSEGKRMAKSFHNYYTVSDLVNKGYDAKAVRYLLLATHYRQQFNFTLEGLDAAKGAVERLTNFMYRLRDSDLEGSGERAKLLMERVEKNFAEAMDDDLGISEALAALFDFVREVNVLLDSNLLSKEEAQQVQSLMNSFDGVLGVIGEIKKEVKLSKEAEELVQKREQARKAKDWKTADEIRTQLKAMGVIIEDTSQGVKWRVEKH